VNNLHIAGRNSADCQCYEALWSKRRRLESSPPSRFGRRQVAQLTTSAALRKINETLLLVLFFFESLINCGFYYMDTVVMVTQHLC
jgi:hypothetical protein